VYPVTHDQVVKYLNSVDVFTLCSFGEGSPNVVKEAMSCNCPMVVTPAGDAAWVVGNTEGCFVGGYEPADFVIKLEQALAFAASTGRTPGRQRILELGLNAEAVAGKLLAIYRQVTADTQTQLSSASKL
jgi:glycosyltransferase involved in cell wall biosynthesis